MDCGHTWTTDEDADKCVCPKCKAKLEVQHTKRQKAMSSTYFSVLTERKGPQLMRAFQMKAYSRKGQKADIYCWEVARYWMNEKGKMEVMARKRTMGIYMDTFCYDSDIELPSVCQPPHRTHKKKKETEKTRNHPQISARADEKDA